MKGARITALATAMVATLTTVAALTACGAPEPPPAPSPNVLLITVDTLRADYLSMNGYDRESTPFIDSLLADGVSFSRAVTPIPRTTQALASLLTGMYPHGHQVRRLFDRLDDDVTTLAELARDGGYSTVAVVSNHILTADRGLGQGFEVYDFAPDARSARKATRSATRRLGSVTLPEKLFLWVHYIDPHVPYFPPKEHVEAFDPDYQGPYAQHFGSVRGGVGDQAYPEDLPKVAAVYQNPLPDEVNAHIRRLYAADIRATDDAIEKLVTALKNKYGPDWAIVFTSDHGESLGEHDYFYDHGEYVSDAELRVPLGIIMPESHPLRRQGVVDDWVSLVDLMPTLAEVMNLPLPAGVAEAVEGRSLVPYLRGETLPPRPVFAESGKSFFPDHVPDRVRFDIAGRFRAAIEGDWKLVWTPFRTVKEYQLFNLAENPGETDDRAATENERVEHLAAQLAGWVRQTDGQETVLSPEDREKLRSLGYVD